MKHTRKLFAAALSLCLLAGCAAQRGSTDGTPVRTEKPLITPAPSVAPAVTDVPTGEWYSEAVNWCLTQGLMDPVGTDTFAPDADANRATLAAALYRAAGSPAVGASDFPDVTAGSWYANAAAWAKDNNVIAGYSDGRFGGEDPITREQTVAVLWRYSGNPEVEAGQDFTDEGSISSYAAQAVDWSRVNGVVSGNPDGSFNPPGTHYPGPDCPGPVSVFEV